MHSRNRTLPGATVVALFALLIVAATPARAQFYYFLRFSGATIMTVLPTDRNINCDDCTGAVVFPFFGRLYGTTFTTVNVSSNGNLQFGTNNNDWLQAALPASGFTYTIFANWDDFDTSDNAFPHLNGVYTSIDGSAPNRIFNIEWRTRRHAVSLPPAPTDNFEIRFYEGKDRFDIVYGAVGMTGGTSTVGVQKDGTDFTQYESGTAGTLSNGLRLTAITAAALQASLRATAISHVPGNTAVTASFTALAGATYRLERKLSLSEAMWQPIAGVSDLRPASDGPAQITDPDGLSHGAAYYRVRAVP
jgi:hypothetical protein